MRTCLIDTCSNQLGNRNQTGRCIEHHKTKTPKTCAARGCSDNLGPTNRSGFCRQHFYLSQDRAECNQRSRQWYENNKEIALAKALDGCHKRNALKRDQFIEEVDRSSVWIRDSGICYLCRCPADNSKWHLGHIIPLARGGEHSYANTAVYHPKCNLYQGSKLIEELEATQWK